VPRVSVVMPAYNAEKTLKQTVEAITPGVADEIILVDDASQDNTVEVARELGLHVVVHPDNRGYGGNQKTCYQTALERGADIIVMIHPDFQYDPRRAGDMVQPIKDGKADAVLGSRFLTHRFYNPHMPIWRNIGNVFLSMLENLVFSTNLSEFHTGYKAYHRRVLEQIPFHLNSDDFVFDQETNAQMIAMGFTVTEVAVDTRYFEDASSISFMRSVKYGLETLEIMGKFLCQRFKIKRFPMFTPKDVD
jgi:glycosyltransferase involved in cell wall biosynthesis